MGKPDQLAKLNITNFYDVPEDMILEPKTVVILYTVKEKSAVEIHLDDSEESYLVKQQLNQFENEGFIYFHAISEHNFHIVDSDTVEKIN